MHEALVSRDCLMVGYWKEKSRYQEWMKGLRNRAVDIVPIYRHIYRLTWQVNADKFSVDEHDGGTTQHMAPAVATASSQQGLRLPLEVLLYSTKSERSTTSATYLHYKVQDVGGPDGGTCYDARGSRDRVWPIPLWDAEIVKATRKGENDEYLIQ
ncbi:hypothetical protein M426DRAFT_17996 [Hypoxylon sp. CI-4A]|nr:hypothetical protein M426DRAFT_17996 [Hypoxylon sp. CI-4A]